METQPNEPISQNPTEVPKVVKPTNKENYYKTLGTIDTQLFPFCILQLGVETFEHAL